MCCCMESSHDRHFLLATGRDVGPWLNLGGNTGISLHVRQAASRLSNSPRVNNHYIGVQIYVIHEL